MAQINLTQLQNMLLIKRNITIDKLYFDPTEITKDAYLYDSNRNVICYYAKGRGQWVVQPQHQYIIHPPKYILPVEEDLLFENWRLFKVII
ncbi:hypothetical protein ACU6XS_23395 [Klebsiella aerogenes]|nr:hypothetical protein [Klebsiella pneumoniae]